MIGILIRGLAGMLLRLAAPLVGRVLLALGFSAVSFTGFTVTLGWLRSQVQDNISALPIDVLNFLAWLWVDKSIGVIFSAYSAALLIRLAGSTSVQFWAMRKSL